MKLERKQTLAWVANQVGDDTDHEKKLDLVLTGKNNPDPPLIKPNLDQNGYKKITKY